MPEGSRKRPALRARELRSLSRQFLGSDYSSVLFRAGYLSYVVGLRLIDGREVVVKVRQASSRTEACHLVHRTAFAAGFPCPEPLLGPTPFGQFMASVETYMPGGEPRPQRASAAELYAAPLARLTRITSGMQEFDLNPVLPWAGWEHDERSLWPSPDDRDEDLNRHPDPFLDEIGERVRRRLTHDSGPRVVGHADWYPANLRWQGDKLLAVHDWDSVASLSEAGLAGVAASTYCVMDGATSIEQTEAFLEAYADARGHVWSADETEVCWASGLWRITFDAKKQSLDESESANRQDLIQNGEERLRRAGA